MQPLLLKAHLLILLLSVLSVALRTFWAIRGNDIIHNQMLLKLHKLVSLLVILSGFALCVAIEQYPFVNGWVTEKFVLLFAYVAFAMLAFKPVMNLNLRKGFIGLTVILFSVIFYIAKAKVGLVLV